MAKALLLIDSQHDFLLCDGRMPVTGNQIDNVIAAACNAVADAQAIGDVIVAIGNEFPRSSFVANSSGATLRSQVLPAHNGMSAYPGEKQSIFESGVVMHFAIQHWTLFCGRKT